MAEYGKAVRFQRFLHKRQQVKIQKHAARQHDAAALRRGSDAPTCGKHARRQCAVKRLRRETRIAPGAFIMRRIRQKSKRIQQETVRRVDEADVPWRVGGELARAL